MAATTLLSTFLTIVFSKSSGFDLLFAHRFRFRSNHVRSCVLLVFLLFSLSLVLFSSPMNFGDWFVWFYTISICFQSIFRITIHIFNLGAYSSSQQVVSEPWLLDCLCEDVFNQLWVWEVRPGCKLRSMASEDARLFDPERVKECHPLKGDEAKHYDRGIVGGT